MITVEIVTKNTSMFNLRTGFRLIVAGLCMMLGKKVTVIQKIAAEEIIAEMKS